MAIILNNSTIHRSIMVSGGPHLTGKFLTDISINLLMTQMALCLLVEVGSDSLHANCVEKETQFQRQKVVNSAQGEF